MDHDQQNASKESQEKVLYWINKSTIENDRFPAALAGSQTTNAAFADTAEKKTFCNHDNVLICKPHKLHGGRKMLSCVFYLESDNALV
ncbi:hypothetical protein HAV15_003308 [Penicillium sp. str. |nr:hypothetical protein HAV15_003308 [Penicillium sp. str. \